MYYRYFIYSFIFTIFLVVVYLLFFLNVKFMNSQNDNIKAIYFPKPTGTARVGTTSYYLVDKSRKDILSKNLQSPYRELMIQVWYPTQEKIVDYIQYAPDAIMYWKTKLASHKKNNTEELSSLDNIFIYEKKDASLDRTHAPLPVLIFSPGFAQMRTSNTALCENIASYQYIVISIDYTYFTEYVKFPDEREIIGNTVNLDTIEKEQELQSILGDDVAFVINSLKDLNQNTNSILHKGLDLDNIGIFGHSIGGSTAIFATKTLSQIKAGINLDGGILGDTNLLTNFNKPFMHILAKESINWANKLKNLNDEELTKYGFKSREYFDKKIGQSIFLTDKLHKNQLSDVYKIIIDKIGHMSFSDVIFLKDNNLLKSILHLNFGLGTLQGDRAIELATLCIVNFFDKYLKNNSEIDIKKAISKLNEIEFQ